jgi:hypothetical protein
MPQFTLVLIANREQDLFAGLDSRLRSRLQGTQTVRFEPYGVDELTAILEARADAAFGHPDAVSTSLLRDIADAAAGDRDVTITLRPFHSVTSPSNTRFVDLHRITALAIITSGPIACTLTGFALIWLAPLATTLPLETAGQLVVIINSFQFLPLPGQDGALITNQLVPHYAPSTPELYQVCIRAVLLMVTVAVILLAGLPNLI